MPYFSLDHCIVYASLLITLIVGLWAGRGITTIREYAVANKMYGTSALVLTYLATIHTGSDIISRSSLTFSTGIIPLFATLGFSIATIFFGLCIADKAVYFKDCLTMGDLMKTFYGRSSSIISGLLGLLCSVFIIGGELCALGIVCKAILGIQEHWSILVGGMVLACYSAHGGIKAVVATDVLQFFMLIIGVPLIAYIALHQAGGIQEVLAQVPTDRLALVEHPQFVYYVVLLLVLITPIGLIDPAVIQRMLMGRTPRQLRNQYLIAAAFSPIINVIFVLIGLSGLVLYPQCAPNDVVTHMLNNLIPVGLKGLTLAGFFALVMSTADSYLHVAGLTVVHDIIKPLCDQRGFSIASEKEKKWAQIATLGIGVIAIGIGLRTTDMFGLLLDSLETTGPILMLPLITGILGLKPEKKAFYTAMGVTIAVWGACKAFLPAAYSYLTTLISILANGITFLSVHGRMNKGFKRAKRSTTVA